MKIFDISLYPNFLDHSELTSTDVCNSIKNYSLEFLQIRNNEAEWEIGFPIFLTPFYKYVYQNKRVIEQRQFYEYYMSENKDFFDKNKFSDDILNGLKARIYRTYPSLVRDLHFSAFLKENFKDATVIYNRKLDVEEGIDLLIVHDNNYWGINLYTNTRRAHIGRAKKETRHSKFENVTYVELPVDFKGSQQCGSFFLYGEKEYQEILNTLL